MNTNALYAVLAVASVVACLVVVLWSLRNLRLTQGVRSPGPYWHYFYYSIPITVLPALIAAYVFGFRHSRVFYGISDTKFNAASMWLVYGVVTFCLALVFFDKIFPKYRFGKIRDSDLATTVAIIVSIIGMLVIIYLYAGFLPIFHLGNVNIGVLRKNVTVEANFSSYYSSAILYLSYLGLAYAGSMRNTTNERVWIKLTLIGVCLLGLLWNGAKAPVLFGLLTYYFSHLYFNKKIINVKKLLTVVLLGIAGIWILYRVTQPDLGRHELLDQLFTRLFLGQIAGYYQAYAVSAPNPQYILTWVPLGSWFGIHVPAYSRFLMVHIYGNTNTNGYLNSFFLQEAWGTLGYLGLIISPMIVGISIVLSMRIMSKSLCRICGKRVIISCLFAFIDTNSITGGFGQFVFFRTLIFTLVISLIIGVLIRLIIFTTSNDGACTTIS